MTSYFCSSNYNRLISICSKSPSFRDSFKMPFTVSLACT